MKTTININARLSEIVKINRCIAEDAINEIMYDAICEMGNYMVAVELEEGIDLEFEKSIAGFPPDILNTIKEHTLREDVSEWLTKMEEGGKLRITLAFLDYYGKNGQDFRRKFPNAFRKWEKNEDALLLKEYERNNGAPDWKEMEKDFGRNANALRMRLEKLGVIPK